MKFVEYQNDITGYKGWIESANGVVIAFIKDNGTIQTQW